MKLKRSIKTSILVGILMSAMPLGLTVYADDIIDFSSGSNSSGGQYLATSQSSHQAGWGIALDTSGDLPKNNAGGVKSHVLGCKVTAYRLTDSNDKIKIKNADSDDSKRAIVANAIQGNRFETVSMPHNGYNSSSFTMYRESFANHYTQTGPYYKSGNLGSNGQFGWLNPEKFEVYASKLSSQTLQGGMFANRDEFFNTNIWNITANASDYNFWFVGQNDSIPSTAKNLAKEITEYYSKNNNTFSEDDVVIYNVEPLVPVELEDDKHQWHTGVALSPIMAAWADGEYHSSLTGLSLSWFEPYVNCTGTDRLFAGDSIGNGSMLKGLNSSGLGAYSLVITPEDMHSYDELPEIPSVPVFQKTGDSVSYVGMSSTIDDEHWNEITQVLSYAMHLTETPPSCGLYNAVSGAVDVMRSYSENAFDNNNNYNNFYTSSYNGVWNAIAGYYGSSELISANDSSIAVPMRMQTNQPGSIESIKGDNTAPYKVSDSLGAISGSDATYSVKKYSVHQLGQGQVVDTNASNESSLGNNDNIHVTEGDVLRNSYAYSIVIESDNIVVDDYYPEPPNIVVWDENTTDKWEATIDAKTWEDIINTLKYANGDNDDSNALGIEYAEKARNARLKSISESNDRFTQNISNIASQSEYESCVAEYNNVKDYINRLDDLYDVLNEASNNLWGLGNPHHLAYGGESWWDVPTGDNTLGKVIYADYSYTDDSVYDHRDDFSGLVTWGVFGVGDNHSKYGTLQNSFNGGTSFEDKWRERMKTNYYDRHATRYAEGVFTEVNWWVPDEGWVKEAYVDFEKANSGGSTAWDKRFCAPYSSSISNKSDGAFKDICGWLWIYAQLNTYREMRDIDITNAKTVANDRLDVLEKVIKSYEELAKEYTENYNKLLQEIPNKLSGMNLVTATISDGKVSNNVEANLTQRNIGLKSENLAKQDMVKIWQFNQAVFADGDFPRSASWTSADSDIWRTATVKMTPIGNTLKPTLDSAYSNSKNQLDFKYRVVKTDNADIAMTVDTIENYSDAKCYTTLNYTDVLKEPYSYGIILNGFDRKRSDNIIREWQISKRMEKSDLNPRDIWNYSESKIIKTFKFKDDPNDNSERSDGNGMIITSRDYKLIPEGTEPNGKLIWTTGKKSNEDAPVYSNHRGGSSRNTADSGTLGILDRSSGSYDYDTSTREDTALYKLTKSWEIDNGSNGSGTIELLTAKITAKSYKSFGNSKTVTGTSSFDYDPADGSSFDIWRDNTSEGKDGVMSFRPIFPMSIASNASSTSENPKPVIPSGDKYILNPSMSGYYLDWFVTPHTHSIKSQYEVKVSYKTKAKIKSNFSTDQEDISVMEGIASGDATPYVKAGQTFEVVASDVDNDGAGDNQLIIDGYCNVQNEYPSGETYVEVNGQRFAVSNDFINYMNGIADELRECDLAVYSTINGVTSSSNNSNAGFSDTYKSLATEHTKAGGQTDADAGTIFKDGNQKNVVVSDGELGTYANKLFNPGSIEYKEGGPFSVELSNKTQDAYNALININEGSSEKWYFEYSEALSIVHCRIVIDYKDYDFGVTISRYESDFKTDTDAYLADQIGTISSAWESMFGYGVSLRKPASTNAHIICMGIDISGLDPNGEARKLFTNDSTGESINAILGCQTPIHIRGSIYDNT